MDNTRFDRSTRSIQLLAEGHSMQDAAAQTTTEFATIVDEALTAAAVTPQQIEPSNGWDRYTFDPVILPSGRGHGVLAEYLIVRTDRKGLVFIVGRPVTMKGALMKGRYPVECAIPRRLLHTLGIPDDPANEGREW